MIVILTLVHARQLCNRHTVKMPIETAQMLCTALQNHKYRSTKHTPTPCLASLY